MGENLAAIRGRWSWTMCSPFQVSPAEVEKSAMIDGFGKLCERAAADNIWVSVEFVPILGVPSLSGSPHLLLRAVSIPS